MKNHNINNSLLLELEWRLEVWNRNNIQVTALSDGELGEMKTLAQGQQSIRKRGLAGGPNCAG